MSVTGHALARQAEAQQRLEARPPRPRPPATLPEVAAQAAQTEADAQAALWRAYGSRSAHERAALLDARAALVREATKLYEVKRALWALRSPGRFLREQARGAM